MRSALYGVGQLLLASKKPRVKELIARSETMTEDEIRSLPEKPDVIKGLLQIRSLGKNKIPLSEKIAELMMKNGNSSSFDVNTYTTKIFQYFGDGVWIKQGSTQVLLQDSWHWMLLPNNQLYFNNSFITCSNISELDELKNGSREIQDGTIHNLKDLDKARLKKLL